MTRLEAAINMAEIIRDINILDCDLLICDAEGTILKHVQAKTFNTNTKVGTKATGGAVSEVIASKKPVSKMIPENLYGIKLKASMIPLIEGDGTLSGVIGTATSLEAQNTLFTASQSIATTSEEISATSEELSSSALLLANSIVKSREAVEGVISEINKTDEILKFVDDIADSSNLLGLNAAIEAARAGEQGQGFRVVADKIREMAEKSSESVKNIRKIIKTIQKNTNGLLDMINKVADLGQQQAASTEEIESAMQELATAASEVETYAEKM
jgi:hypothetical protein